MGNIMYDGCSVLSRHCRAQVAGDRRVAGGRRGGGRGEERSGECGRVPSLLTWTPSSAIASRSLTRQSAPSVSSCTHDESTTQSLLEFAAKGTGRVHVSVPCTQKNICAAGAGCCPCAPRTIAGARCPPSLDSRRKALYATVWRARCSLASSRLASIYPDALLAALPVISVSSF